MRQRNDQYSVAYDGDCWIALSDRSEFGKSKPRYPALYADNENHLKALIRFVLGENRIHTVRGWNRLFSRRFRWAK